MLSYVEKKVRLFMYINFTIQATQNISYVLSSPILHKKIVSWKYKTLCLFYFHFLLFLIAYHLQFKQWTKTTMMQWFDDKWKANNDLICLTLRWPYCWDNRSYKYFMQIILKEYKQNVFYHKVLCSARDIELTKTAWELRKIEGGSLNTNHILRLNHSLVNMWLI